MRFFCPQCEQEFDFNPSHVRKLRFCSMECRRLAQKRGIRPRPADTAETRLRKSLAKRGERNPMWKGDQAQTNAGRERARRWFTVGACEVCGEPGRDRHHVDGNTLNNSPENVQSLCRRCHMTADGRLARFGYEIGINRAR